MDLARTRDLGYEALDRYDREQALAHQLDRLAPSRRAQWPKDDRRSSSQVTPDRAVERVVERE